ncbi:MAG: hypothetical protein JW904_11325 [Spirochaetales bacterium]|nr:hypothetical protein [Spirochaetales bacterium]
MKTRKKGYLPLLILTMLFTLAAIVTIIPAMASKLCLLGYYAHCSFTPISTIICLLGSLITCIVRSRLFVLRS